MRSMRVPAMVLGVVMLVDCGGPGLDGDPDGQRSGIGSEHRAEHGGRQHRGTRL